MKKKEEDWIFLHPDRKDLRRRLRKKLLAVKCMELDRRKSARKEILQAHAIEVGGLYEATNRFYFTLKDVHFI